MLRVQIEIKICKSIFRARRQGKVVAGHAEFLFNDVVIRPNKQKLKVS